MSKRHRHKNPKKAAHTGQALVEVVIAIGLSSFLVLMLSGMLSQTLLLSTTSQNELIAAHAAEELLENARMMSYDKITALVPVNQTFYFVVNKDGSSSPTPTTSLRQSVPVQVDLLSASTLYGEVNPSGSILINSATKWSPGVGNFFLGTASENVVKTSFASGVGSINCYEITVQISYSGMYGPSNGTQYTKHLTRHAFVVQQGLNLQ